MSSAPARARLYAVEASYYAGKIRAYLVHKQIPFEEIQADRRAFAEVIVPRVGWPVVPVMVDVDGTTLQDTSDMFDYYEARHPHPAVLPRSAAGRALSYWLELIGDEWLKLPALHYRWNYNYDFAIAEFGRNNDPDFSPAEQRRIGLKIAAPFQGWLPRLGITSDTAAAVEAAYLEFLDLFDAHLAHHAYLLGDAPTLGDFAFYGPLYAHQYRDPASGAIMRARAPRVCAWVERLRDGATPSRVVEAPDQPAPSLVALLRQQARDFVPVLQTEIPALQRWLADHDAAAELPRYFGEHSFALGRGTACQVTATRALTTYQQWMLQRVTDVYAASSGAEREAIVALFTRIGAQAVLGLSPERRVVRENFRLVRAR